MNTMKLHFAKYPSNGFGAKCNQYYLIDIFGNIFDIVAEWDDILKETFYRINDENGILRGCGYAVDEYYAESPSALIDRLNELDSLEINEW